MNLQRYINKILEFLRVDGTFKASISQVLTRTRCFPNFKRFPEF